MQAGIGIPSPSPYMNKFPLSKFPFKSSCTWKIKQSWKLYAAHTTVSSMLPLRLWNARVSFYLIFGD
jgi:hypothetical protein